MKEAVNIELIAERLAVGAEVNNNALRLVFVKSYKTFAAMHDY